MQLISSLCNLSGRSAVSSIRAVHGRSSSATRLRCASKSPQELLIDLLECTSRCLCRGEGVSSAKMIRETYDVESQGWENPIKRYATACSEGKVLVRKYDSTS